MKPSPPHNSFHSRGTASTLHPVLQLFPYKDHCFDPKCFELPFTSSPSCPILPFPILSLLSAIWVTQQCAEVIHLSDMFAAKWEPARKQNQRIKVWTVPFTTMCILISTLRVQELVALHNRASMVVHSTAYDCFRTRIFLFPIPALLPQIEVSTFFLIFLKIQITKCANSQISPQRKSWISWGTVQSSSFTRPTLLCKVNCSTLFFKIHAWKSSQYQWPLWYLNYYTECTSKKQVWKARRLTSALL